MDWWMWILAIPVLLLAALGLWLVVQMLTHDPWKRVPPHPNGYPVRSELKLCGCQDCSPGDPLPTWTYAHREACEIKEVASWRNGEIRAYLEMVARHRGKEAAAELRMRVWEYIKNGKPA